MMGFDDAAMMGLGAINAGVQIAGAQAQKRGQKKLQKIQQGQEQRHHDFDIKNLGLQQEEVNRNAADLQRNTREDVVDQQGASSSQRNDRWNRNEGERSRRYDALERQKTALNLDWADHITQQKIQRRMQKTQETMQLISAALMQGGSGVGAAFGGSSMG